MFVTVLSMLMLAQAPATATPAKNAPAAQARNTKAAMDAQVRANFARLDTNHDGYVDKAEADAGLNAAVSARQAQLRKSVDARFAALDTNKDGSLSRQEFEAIVKVKGPAAGAPNPYITQNDIDKNGRVALAEALAKASNGFDMIDTNKDGVISAQEVQAARARGRTARK